MIVANRSLAVVAGVDAATKRDSAAIALCAWERGKVQLVNHKIYTPTPGSPIDLEATLEAALLDYSRRFELREVRYDPYQFARSAATLQKAGLHMHEYPQTVPNLTRATANLYELLKSGSLRAYPDDEIRLAFQRAIVLETSRGMRIAKEKGAHKIDIVISISMAALAAVEVLSDDGGFDITAASAAIVAVAHTALNGAVHVAETVGSLFTGDENDDHRVSSAEAGDQVIEHPGVFDPRTGRPATPHPASASCGQCVLERKNAAVRGGVSHPIVATAGLLMRTTGRLGTEFIAEDVAAARAINDGTAFCGGCQQRLSMPHLPSCPEYNLLAPEEAKCLDCRARVGHESDCRVITDVINTGW